MSQNPPTLTERAPDHIEAAYHTFKGGTGTLSTYKARQLLEVTHTARIDGRHCQHVTVYLKTDAVAEYPDEFENVPDIIEEAAEAHNLVEVDRSHTHLGTLDSITYAAADDE